MFGGMPEAKEAIDMVIDFVNEHYGQPLPGTKTA
jgi:hypothetical protein